ncbi:MFS transporter [Devosia sp. MC532]|uniref:MFS transporter n=1 Tax=Devosia sp. MC532 TaxID=2799788 RepID=UPI0018F480F2|nr:MFS transporter [Devosia sp. MC532]MBJ7578222.1 MFS transporter [Devosia sp. MC532]
MGHSVRMPVTPMLGTSMFFSGITYAATAPYASLVGVDALGMAPSVFATVMAIGSLIGLISAIGLGLLSDRIKDRRWLVILTAFAGMTGHALIFWGQSPLAFIIATAVIMPLGLGCFSQCLGFMRVYFVHHRPDRADFIMTIMRMMFTLAWVIVPPLVGWIASAYSVFLVYLLSSLSYLAIGAIFLILLRNRDTAVQSPRIERAEGASLLSTFAIERPKVFGLCSIVLMWTGARTASYIVPLFIVKELGGTLANVGTYSGINAAIEAPSMFAIAWLTTKVSKETLLAIAGLCLAVFLASVSLAPSILVIYCLLVINAVGVALIQTQNIAYAQDAIKGRVGLSTSLIDLMGIATNLLSAAAFAVLMGLNDYRLAIACAAGFSLIGALSMAGSNFKRLGRLRSA